MLELIGIIAQVILVICDVTCDIVIDCLYFFIFALCVKVERFHDLIQFCRELVFLGFCCVILNRSVKCNNECAICVIP